MTTTPKIKSITPFRKIESHEFAEKMSAIATRFGWRLIGGRNNDQGLASYWQAKSCDHSYQIETRLENGGTKIVLAPIKGNNVLRYLPAPTLRKDLEIHFSASQESWAMCETLVRAPFLSQVRSLFQQAQEAQEAHIEAIRQQQSSAQQIIQATMPWRSNDLQGQRVVGALGQGKGMASIELSPEYDTRSGQEVFDLTIEGLSKEQVIAAIQALQTTLGKGFHGEF